MTQSELAQRLNVSQRAVAAYEIGERHPSAKVLMRIREEFDLTLQEAWDLFYDEAKL